MPPDKKIKEVLKKLNPEQKEAVEVIEGPVMVIAGPGTGKTQVLTLRIANILEKTDLPPEAILALAFTDSAVNAMKKRLVEIIGSAGYRVNIKTFHRFCNEVIHDYPESFPSIISRKHFNPADQLKIVQGIVSKEKLELLKPFGDPEYYLRPIMQAISELKREAVESSSFKKMVSKTKESFSKRDDIYHEKGRYKGEIKGVFLKEIKLLEKNEELARIYNLYQEKLKQEKGYDFDDMIMEVLDAMKKDKELRLQLQEKYQYVLVDEHQDTNNSQNRVIELLMGFYENPNIFFVGDEKQAIFRFQGASFQNFNYFQKLYPQTRVINLKNNYRSTKEIIDLAESLIPSQERLEAFQKTLSQKPKLYSFSTPDSEAYFLAKDILQKIASGVKPQEIAIIYRDNRDSEKYAETLSKMKVPFQIESERDALKSKETQKFLLLLKAVSDFGNEELFIKALHLDFLKIDPLDVYRLLAAASQKRTSIFKEAEGFDKISLAAKQMELWAISSRNKSLPEVVERIARESGFLEQIISFRDLLEDFFGFFDEARLVFQSHPDYDLKEFLEYLETAKKQGISIRNQAFGVNPDCVRLMTGHKSKGLEFDYVYIVDCRDRHWGNRRNSNPLSLPAGIYSLNKEALEKRDSNEDERRLFYVSLTRARKGICFSYAKQSLDGKEQLASAFLSELSLKEEDTSTFEKEFEKEKANLFAKEKSMVRVSEKRFVKELFTKRGLSVTALNNYLECPFKYFYLNLLRLPRASTKYQLYGIAVHDSLKDFFNQEKEDKEFLLERFRFHLRKQPLVIVDYEVCLKKGEKALNGYFDHYQGTWEKKRINESFIEVPGLNGKIDKVEITSSGVNVVDYKTGSFKSRNEIEGLTKNSLGNEKRQLVFYNLLLGKQKRFQMVSGEIDFIEPDKKGNYHKEKFLITREETEELEKLIKKVSEEIQTLSFWDKRCNNKECEFCRLRELNDS